jgi:hypothetical protein
MWKCDWEMCSLITSIMLLVSFCDKNLYFFLSHLSPNYLFGRKNNLQNFSQNWHQTKKNCHQRGNPQKWQQHKGANHTGKFMWKPGAPKVDEKHTSIPNASILSLRALTRFSLSPLSSANGKSPMTHPPPPAPVSFAWIPRSRHASTTCWMEGCDTPICWGNAVEKRRKEHFLRMRNLEISLIFVD